ncbi:penicillin acylase family protein [Streptomyces sp. HNM0575]|uniref:penicillin acylase family protein n=1 Tax=Streptomyces sp. HNM0575 TaxID=2716338 RepID=UPI00145D2446|nr:penicillin acylase family protein [Streptomyces sp. HNM0575]NLU76589.1 penicillin acylase family protein [Streptomyces sp. HNM0575]
MPDDQDSPTVFEVPGLSAPVEIRIDTWGVPHLYASSRDDLYLAQGFNAARDRLFQIDLWRRRGLGLLSGVLGERYLEHDRAARLFLYRGGMEEEWRAYGPDVEPAAKAFTAGINAFVELCRRRRSLLPPEFALLGYEPALWEPSDVARIRSHGLYYNLNDEVARALTMRDFGPEAEDLRKVREPSPHRLRVPDGLDLSVIPDDVLRVYRLATVAPWAGPAAVPTAEGRTGPGTAAPRTGLDGSNNWVLGPSRTATGRPMLANDPHRAVTLPSLRYLVHLSAPGLDVVGGGEPALPGVSIGHNGRVAFGLTIFPIDQEDLYVYRTDPDDPTRYRYGGGWESMVRVTESVPVAGGEDAEAELWFTRHGPVIRRLPERNVAFAVRAAWLEPGMAPYLGSLNYMGAGDAGEFTEAMRRWGSPGENQVYADTAGTIGWCPAGRVPVRHGWDGTLPVPGDGRYEWAGHHEPGTLPSVRDPHSGWIATANQMNLPPSYPAAERTVTYDWYAPYRYLRIAECLEARDDWTVEDCVRLQTDHLSLPARGILPLLDGLSGSGEDPRTAAALGLLRGWDARLAADSPAAALFEIWFRRHLRPALLRSALRHVLPGGLANGSADGPADGHANPLADGLVERALARILPAEDAAADARGDLSLLLAPEGRLGPDGAREMRRVLLGSLAGAFAEAERLLGSDTAGWRWGDLHRSLLCHPLAGPVRERTGSEPEWTTIGPAPRGGSGDTVGAAAYTSDFRQSGGATFRLVVDVGSWDDSVAMNSPGQSGRPDSPHYSDLFGPWAEDSSFPLLYSRAAVEEHTERILTLRPVDGGTAP